MNRREFVKLGAAAGLAGAGGLALLSSTQVAAVTPGAPTYTILRSGSNYIARNDSGVDEYSNTLLHMVLQYAIDHLPAAGGSIVLKPSINDDVTKVAQITTAVNWPKNKPVVLVGETEDVTLQPTATAVHMFNLNGTGWSDLEGVRGCVWANFSIDCSQLPTGGRAIDGQFVFNFIFDHVEIRNLNGDGKRGISIVPGQNGSFRNLKANVNNGSLGSTGGLVYLEHIGGNGSNMGFYDCVFSTAGPTDQGVYVSPFQIAFFQCHFTNTKVATGNACTALNFYSCEWEIATLLVRAGTHVSLIGCDFAGIVPSPASVIVVGESGNSSLTRLTMSGCAFGRSGDNLVADFIVDVSAGNCRVDMHGCWDALVTIPPGNSFWKGLTTLGNVIRQSGGQIEQSTTRVANQGTAVLSQPSFNPQTVFNIAHGLAGNPDPGVGFPANRNGTILVTPGSPDAKGDFSVTADATNIRVTYATAPPNGVNNVVLRWYASVL